MKSFPMWMKSWAICVTLLTISPSTLSAAFAVDASQIKLVDQIDTFSRVAAEAAAALAIDPDRTIVINGDRIVSTEITTAREIVFKPNASLILDPSKGVRIFYIIADQVKFEVGSMPGKISWKSPSSATASNKGKAAGGRPGPTAGGDGQAGSNGLPGDKGTSGEAAPSVVLVARSVDPGLIVELSGAAGGKGGTGQSGGDGGPGAQGEPAQEDFKTVFGSKVWLPNCASGPGKGGNGGPGGAAGKGGMGGTGGTGGNVTFVMPSDVVVSFVQSASANLAGGKSGPGGEPGYPGAGGVPGPEGQLASFCNSAGRQGNPGQGGEQSESGNVGQDGKSGSMFYAQLSDAQFISLFHFSEKGRQ